MMKFRWFLLLGFLLIETLPVSGQSTSCTDTFSSFDVFKPELNSTVRIEDYQPTITWYGNCILLGLSSGLWLYDPEQPDDPLRLVQTEERAIDNIAVDPIDMTIAFNVAQEATVYLLHSDGEVSSVSTGGQAVTDISFSPDGSLLAVATSNVDAENGMYHDAHVQIWKNEEDVESTIITEASVIPDVFFVPNNQYLLTQLVNPGYFGDEVSYWDIVSVSSSWNYSDLLSEYQSWSANDPLAITSVTMKGEIVALGGVYGYYNERDFYGVGVHLWNAETQQRQLEINIKERFDEAYVYEMPVLLLALDNSAAKLATSTGTETIQLWNTNDGSQLGEITLYDAQIEQISFSPDSMFLAVLTEEDIEVYSTVSLKVTKALHLPLTVSGGD